MKTKIVTFISIFLLLFSNIHSIAYADDFVSITRIYKDYAKINRFSNGLAMVTDKNGNIGYINQYGAEVIPCIYREAFGSSDFSEGLAYVHKDDYGCYINKQGKEVLSLKGKAYSNMRINPEFKEGVAMFADKETYEKIFIDKSGKVISKDWDFSVKSSCFDQGVMVAYDYNVEDKKYDYFFINKKGERIKDLDFDDGKPTEIDYRFQQGLLKIETTRNERQVISYFDRYGKSVIEYCTDDLYEANRRNESRGLISEGIFLAYKNGNEYIVDTMGNMEKTSEKIQYCDYILGGNICIASKNIMAPRSELKDVAFPDNATEYIKDVKWGILRKDGTVILPIEYDYCYKTGGIIVVENEVKKAIFDIYGNKLTNFEYPKESWLNGQMATAYNVDGKWYISRVTNELNEIYGLTSSKSIIQYADKKQEVPSYKIYNHEYVSIRDVAVALKGTDKEFSVKWDGDVEEVILETGNTYKETGKELEFDVVNPVANIRNILLTVNGEAVRLSVYSINGNISFRLNDLKAELEF